MFADILTCQWWAGGDVQGHGVVWTPTCCCAPPTIMHAHSVHKPVATKQLHICQAGQQAVAEACRVVVAVNFRNRTSEPRTILGARLLPQSFRNCGGEQVADRRLASSRHVSGLPRSGWPSGMRRSTCCVSPPGCAPWRLAMDDYLY